MLNCANPYYWVFLAAPYFNSKGTTPFISAAEAAIMASNLPGSATQACFVSSK